MSRHFACSAVAWTLLLGLTHAAPKAETKPTSAEAAASQRLEEVLRLEVTSDQPDRAAVLQALRADYPAHAPIHWASGQISSAGNWRDYAEEPALTAASDRLAEYRELRGVGQITAERHQELAAWCRKQGLNDQERAHLWQTLLANPAQPDVWRKLGYQQVEGQWLSPEAAAAAAQAQRTYQQNLQRWQKQAQSISQRLESPQPGVREKARDALRAIDDEAAIPALELALAYTSAEQGLEFVSWVKQWPGLPATFALTRLSVLSPWEDVRQMATDGLRPRRWEHFIPSLLEMLSEQLSSDVVIQNPVRMRIGTPLITVIHQREFRHAIEIRQHRVVAGLPRSDSSTSVLDRRRASLQAAAVNILAQRRVEIVNNLRLSELAFQFESTLDDDTVSQQVESTLQGITGQTTIKSASEWWTWWGSLTATPVQDSAAKGIVEVAETSTYRPLIANMILRGSCLPAGTLVYTELGHRPVESIRVGDRVLSKSVESGELTYRTVTETTTRRPQPLVKLHTSGETIEATQGHHFWVSGKGWRMAREIQPGDRLHGVNGTVRITDVSTGDMADVYNLVVDRASTYFVGQSLVLSHDVTFPAPTDTKVPGLAAR